MFADPQTVTINAVPITLPRIESEQQKSLYASSDSNVKMTISHQPTKDRTRRMVRLDKRIIATDPLMATNSYQNLAVYVVIDQPNFGFVAADIDYVVQALKAWLTTPFVTKVVGAES